MRHITEIEKEIAALKALVPVGEHKKKTERSISLAIVVLEMGYDITADEFFELNESDRDLIEQTLLWKEGLTSQKISTGWGKLVA